MADKKKRLLVEEMLRQGQGIAVFDGMDLSDADLSGLCLRGCSFEDTNLSDASLMDTDLCESNIRGTNFCGVKLNPDWWQKFVRAEYDGTTKWGMVAPPNTATRK